MTLSDIASLITDKLGRTDTTSIAIAKRFINRRYQMIWDSTLWLESLATAFAHVQDRDVTISADPDVYYAGGSSSKIDRVLAATYSEADVEQITRITVFSDYVLIYADANASRSVGDTVYVNGVPSQGVDFGSVERSISGINGKQVVTELVTSSSFKVAKPSSISYAADFTSITGFLSPDANAFAEIQVSEWWNHFRVDPGRMIDQGNSPQTPEGFIHLPKDASGNPRIRLLPTPPKEGLLHVLGKLKWVALGDNDSPSVHGFDNILLAYGEGDMLERSRKYSKAQVKFQEAGELLAAARQQQAEQFASEIRIIPDSEVNSYTQAFGYAA
jgi:hypothetical protein